MEFQRRRKEHYKEYEAVKLARKLIEEELLDDDEEVEELENEVTERQVANPSSGPQFVNAEQSQNPQDYGESVEEEVETFSSNPSTRSGDEDISRRMDVDPPLPRDHPCYGRGGIH